MEFPGPLAWTVESCDLGVGLQLQEGLAGARVSLRSKWPLRRSIVHMLYIGTTALILSSI